MGVLGPAIRLLDEQRPWRVFDRPIFIIAPPRSGSTLLFDLLAGHPDVVSWPFEASDALAAARPPEHPLELGHRWPPSYASERLRRRLSRELYLGRLAARRRQGLSVTRRERFAPRKVRLLEKTPENVLRVEVLADLYPDAKFVFLHRDAPAGIASLIEAWEAPTAAHVQFVHESRVINWMMLAPPGWLDMADAPVAERAAFQWRAGTEQPLNAFATMDASRWMRTSYEDLLGNPEETLRRVLAFAELTAAEPVLAGVRHIGATGRTSLSAPRPDKWRDRASGIEPLLPALAELRRRLGYSV